MGTLTHKDGVEKTFKQHINQNTQNMSNPVQQLDDMRRRPHPVGPDGYPFYYVELRRLGTYDRFLRTLGVQHAAGNLSLRNFEFIWRVNYNNAVMALDALNLPRSEYIMMSLLITRYFEAVWTYWLGGATLTTHAGCA